MHSASASTGWRFLNVLADLGADQDPGRGSGTGKIATKYGTCEAGPCRVGGMGLDSSRWAGALQ